MLFRKGRCEGTTTTIRHCGYEAAFDLFPHIGTDRVTDIICTIEEVLSRGKALSLTEIKRMFGLKGDERDRRYLLDPEQLVDIDTMFLHKMDENGDLMVNGQRIFVRGLMKRRAIRR